MLRGVVTTGGRVDVAFAGVLETPTKALAPFGAGVLLDVVIAALRGAGITEIAVVGGTDVAAHLTGTGIRVIPADADGSENVLRALDAWPDGDLVYAACDVPFIDASSVRAFLEASAGYDLTMPLAEGAAYEAAYPGASAHVTAIGDARVANGSIFFISAAGRPAIRRLAGAFFRARKSLFAMARLLGPALLVRFLVRRLRIGDVERRAQTILGVRAAGIRDASPALCYDIDSLEDYRYACARR